MQTPEYRDTPASPRSMRVLAAPWTAVSLLLLACASTADPVMPASCVPDQVAYQTEIRGLVESHCGRCHSSEPQFGAPFSLLDYGSLVEGPEGTRVVDRMHQQLQTGSMPPTGAPQPPPMEADAIAAWASCGEVRIRDAATGATRPPFVAPEHVPEGLDTIDVRADEEEVGPDALDRYEEFFFTNLVEEDVFIRRFEAVVDDARVVHHLTLRRGESMSDAGMRYLYAWAPGTGDFQFPEGGVRLRPADVLRLEIHYNNGARAEGVRDSSGVRLHVGAPGGDEYVMADPGPGAAGFSIAARAEAEHAATCTVNAPVRMIASMPHMHEAGDSFALEHVRAGGDEPELVLGLGSWDFETQLFYDVPLELEVGDQLTVRCGYVNPRDEAIQAGTRTQDEMCFAFSYVTPPNADFCDGGARDAQPELVYSPGSCARASVDPRAVTGEVAATGPEFDAAGELPQGRFGVREYRVVTPTPALLGTSSFTVAGTLGRVEDDLDLDLALHFIAPTAELRGGRQSDLSVAGTLLEADGPSGLESDCPSPGVNLPLVFGVANGSPAVRFTPDFGGLDLTFWILFEPV